MEPLPVNINFDENYGIKKHSRLRKFEKSLNFLEILNDRFKNTGDNSRLQNRFFNDALSTQPRITPIPKKNDQINFNSGRNRFTSPKHKQLFLSWKLQRNLFQQYS